MHAVYNEIEPYAADWLQNLIAQGSIADGRVDTRSIAALTADDVAGPGQRHFFAGIGVWSLALRLAGWPDDLPVWTGSCPCQPFSQAGRRGGTADERHLWPEWFRLIEQCLPSVVLGEQVASPDGLAWFDVVRADLERAGYAVGGADLCAAGVGAPHIRQRLWFVAVAHHDDDERLGVIRRELSAVRDAQPWRDADRSGAHGDRLGDGSSSRGGRNTRADDGAQGAQRVVDRRVADVSVAAGADGARIPDAEVERRDAWRADSAHGRAPIEFGRLGDDGRRLSDAEGLADDVRRDPWSPCEWVRCNDPRHGIVTRPVEPGTFPLAHGSPSRVVGGGTVEIQPRTKTLRGYGNAIVAEVAATWIDCVIDALIAE